MAENKLKISADTSEVKKSLLDLGKQFKDIKGSKVSIFAADDKKFIKTELKKELTAMKARLVENRQEIKKLVEEQQNLVDGTKEELANRQKILAAYKIQAKLGKDMADINRAKKDNSAGGMGGLAGGGTGIMGKIAGAVGLGALAAGAFALAKSIQATQQYVSGAQNRIRLKGLGEGSDNFGGPEELARVGLTEQQMIQRRIDATSILGKNGTNNQTEMKKAGFERAYGLEGGTMTGIAGSLRGQAGGAAATDVQMKLQASIMAAGLEDAIGPYLETATKLLGDINENGTSNTTEMIGILAQLSKDGQRTPEQIAKMMSTVNSSVKNASGEGSAFIQTAFARAGIGGNTLGGTKFAMQSGGIMGLNKAELAKRGYNPDLLANMEKTGMFSEMGQRSGALLDQFKSSGGMSKGQSIGGITDVSRMIGMNNMANNVFGTKGEQGFDVLKMLEQVQNKQMTQKTFDDKLKKMQEETPETKRLDDINASLAGQTEIMTNINTNLMEALGKSGASTRNALVEGENQGLIGANNVVGAISDSGAPNMVQSGIKNTGKALFGGGIGDWLYDKTHPSEVATQSNPSQGYPSADDIGKSVAKNQLPMNLGGPKVTIKNVLPDGKITERTTK